MLSSLIARGSAALVAVAVPSMLAAQAWTPGAEIMGQSIQVTTNGIGNTVYFDPGGAARIVSPAGNVVQGTWAAANGSLCLNVGAARECWPYASPFQANQLLTLTSSCNSTSQWLASAVNAPPAQSGSGERGR